MTHALTLAAFMLANVFALNMLEKGRKSGAYGVLSAINIFYLYALIVAVGNIVK